MKYFKVSSVTKTMTDPIYLSFGKTFKILHGIFTLETLLLISVIDQAVFLF
jgi:hypothetical protein